MPCFKENECHCSNQSGFSLLEVLISLVILAVGLLGLGGLQVASLKGAANSHSRNIASMYAMELADRMRANPEGVAAGFYGSSVNCDSINECRGETFCSPQELALFDLQEVQCGMKRDLKREGGVVRSLTNGALTVICDAGCNTPRAVHDIKITWGETSAHEKMTETIVSRSLVFSVIP